MTSRSFSPPVGTPRPDLSVPEAAWLALWRTFWLDLPLMWAGEIDRFLFQCLPPVGEGPSTVGT